MNVTIQPNGLVIKTCDNRVYFVDNLKDIPEARHIYQSVLTNILSNKIMNIYHNFQHKAMLDFGDKHNCSILRMEMNPASVGEDGLYHSGRDVWLGDDQKIGKSWHEFMRLRAEERNIPYGE